MAQNKYISSKRASRLTGYAQDYIGQLVRLKKVSATKVGKAWFVDEAGLMRHVHGSTRLGATGVKELAAVTTSKAYRSSVTAGINYPPTWSPITYITDNSPLAPIEDISDSRDTVKESIVPVRISRTWDTPRTGRSAERSVDRSRASSRSAQTYDSAAVSAVSMDGIRFQTPETAPRRPFVEVLPDDSLTLLPARQKVGTSAVSFALRAVVAGVVGAVLIFFVPIVG